VATDEGSKNPKKCITTRGSGLALLAGLALEPARWAGPWFSAVVRVKYVPGCIRHGRSGEQSGLLFSANARLGVGAGNGLAKIGKVLGKVRLRWERCRERSD
jgi:hypothetical protein